MADTVLAVCKMPNVGGDPLDTVHNSFVFSVPDPITNTTRTNLTNLLEQFYAGSGTGQTNAVIHYMSHSLDNTLSDIEFYDITTHLDGSPHGSPFGLKSGSFGVTGSGISVDLPEGVAICLSYAANYGALVEFGGTDTAIPTGDRAVDLGAPTTHTGKDRPRARKRGRIYLGPLCTAALDDTGTNRRALVASVCKTDIVNAAKDLQVACEALGADYHWVQWSRRDANVSRISSAWVDDRFDYQRRREDQGIVRSTLVF